MLPSEISVPCLVISDPPFFLLTHSHTHIRNVSKAALAGINLKRREEGRRKVGGRRKVLQLDLGLHLLENDVCWVDYRVCSWFCSLSRFEDNRCKSGHFGSFSLQDTTLGMSYRIFVVSLVFTTSSSAFSQTHIMIQPDVNKKK